ncbi:meprin A subunit beta-like [Xenentodon cancila]
MALRWTLLVCFSGLAAANLSGETETDADEGRDWDIFHINEAAGLDMLEGDIELFKTSDRNAIIGEEYRWPTTIPYYLEDSLEMNAKGVILKAFDQYRLKTCIDFTPWKGEENYISVFKGSGCYSSIGNLRVGKQQLSVGKNCDRLGTVEHEFLHALGFWHEQSRADRDDYVHIMWDQIEPGKLHNFKTYDDTVSSTLGIPYDYGSVMHYSKTSFSIDSEPTIVTKIPQFMDVIGQRMSFSASDLTKLNRLYNCTTSSVFVNSCNFEEENICGMIQGSSKAKWEQLSSVTGGPQTDFTNMGQCKGKGYFMHLNTASAEPEESASLESRWFYPRPGPQCLQFFLHHTAAADDVLNIYVKDYDNAHPSGKLKLFKSISGGVTGTWELHNVNLNMTQKARVVFEAVRGMSPSNGGFSLDDINLSSMKCPEHIWHIRNITSLLATTPTGRKLYSPRFLSPAGYSYQVGVYLNGRSNRPGFMATYFHLTSGPNDHKLKWPCPWQQVTIVLMDQQSDIRQQMNMHRMFTTDPSKTSSDGTEHHWDDPRKVGSKITASDGSYYYRGPGSGTSTFITHKRLTSRKFIKGDDAFFLLSLEDISDLLAPQSMPHAEPRQMKVDDLQEANNNRTAAPAVGAFMAAVVLMVSMLIVVNAWRRRRVQKSSEDGDTRGPGVHEDQGYTRTWEHEDQGYTRTWEHEDQGYTRMWEHEDQGFQEDQGYTRTWEHEDQGYTRTWEHEDQGFQEDQGRDCRNMKAFDGLSGCVEHKCPQLRSGFSMRLEVDIHGSPQTPVCLGDRLEGADDSVQYLLRRSVTASHPEFRLQSRQNSGSTEHRDADCGGSGAPSQTGNTSSPVSSGHRWGSVSGSVEGACVEATVELHVLSLQPQLSPGNKHANV